MSQQCPLDLSLLELCNTDLAGEGAVGLIEDILGAYANFFADMLAGEEEVEGGRGDDDLCYGG